MELLQKIISKKYLALSFIMLMMTMGVVSCDCGGKKEEETAGGLELTFGKDQLPDPERKTKLTIKATKATKLEGLKLIATLTTSGAAATGNVKLTVGSNSETVEVGKESTLDLLAFLGLNADVELQEGEEKPVDIEFAPNGEQDLTLTVEIKNSDEVVGSAKTVEWKAGSVIKLEVKTDKNIKGTDEATITVTNDSKVAVTPSEVEVEFTVSNASEFVLGSAGAKKSADKVSLRDILGNDTAIGPNKGTATFKVKLSDDKGENASDLSFKMSHKGNEVFATAKVVGWKDTNVIKLLVTDDRSGKIKGIEVVKVTVENDSKVAVKPSTVTVTFNVTNGGKFNLGAEANLGDGASKTLEEILGDNFDIAAGGTAEFNIVLNAAATAPTVTDSALELTMAQGPDVVFARAKVVDWQAVPKSVALESTNAKSMTVKRDGAKPKLPVKNTGAVDADATKIKIKVTKVSGDDVVKFNGVEVHRGTPEVIAVTTSLIIKSNKVENLPLHIEANGGNAAEFLVELIYDSNPVIGFSKKLIWSLK